MDKISHMSDCITRCDVIGITNALTNNQFDVNTRDRSHGLQTIAMRVCHLNITSAQRLDILDTILARNPDINIRDSNDRTALHHACIGQCAEIFQTLACCTNCDINALDSDGNTPLIFAVLSNNNHVLDNLLESFGHLGLNAEHKNNKGLTAYDEAQRKGYHDICDILSNVFNVMPSSNNVNMSDKNIPRNGTKVVTGRVTRRQLRKKQAEQLGPVIGGHQAALLPARNELIHTRVKSTAQYKTGVKHKPSAVHQHEPANHVTRATSHVHNTDQNSIHLKSADHMAPEHLNSYDAIEQEYFAEFRQSDEGSDDLYSDDDFCADDECEDDSAQIYDKTVTDLNFNLTLREKPRHRHGSFSLPDLHKRGDSLVSSCKTSSLSVRSEGARVGQIPTLQNTYGGCTKQELALPQIVQFSQDSSSDESSDDSYTEPLTPRSKGAPQKGSMSLPEITRSSFVPKLAIANFITPRNVDLLFTTDSESSAPNTFRGIDITKNMADSLPLLTSRTIINNSPRIAQPKTTRGSVTCNKQSLSTPRVITENPESWLYNKSQKKVELRLVSTQYHR